MRAAALACVVLGSCGSCKDAPAPAAKGPPPRSATVPGPGVPQVRRPSLPPPPRAGSAAPTAVMTSVTVDEITAVIPAIPGAAVIDTPTAAPNGGQVHFAWCVTAGNQAGALDAIRTGLTAAGWTDLHDRGVGARVAISGDHAPYRLTASISAAPRPGCSPADGKWFASVAAYKIESVTHPPPPPPAP